MHLTRRFVASLLVMASVVVATQYHHDWAVNNAQAHYGKGNSPYDPDFSDYRPADCANFASQNFIAGVGGPLLSWSKRYTEAEFRKLNKEASCHQPEIWVDPHGCIPRVPDLRYVLVEKMKCQQYKWTPAQRPSHAWQLPSDIEPGDYAFYYNPKTGEPGHAMTIIDVDRLNGRVTYVGHTTDRNDGDLLGADVGKTLEIVHVPSVINGCRHIYVDYPIDSTFSQKMTWRHGLHCCWHENLAGSWPWTTRSSAYACLSWAESSGTTFDTLILPRVNLARCSAVVFRQVSNSNLVHGSHVIEVRGSIDNGATWPYLLGNDTLTEASMPWASNQRDVRIAWIYRGPVQANRYWCVDNIEILAKPTWRHDVSASEIRWPKGYLSNGQTVEPSVFVWNHGMSVETLGVTLRIGAGYEATVPIKLYPYDDSCVSFPLWTAVPGVYNAVAFAVADSDQNPADDTVVQPFAVVTDTWVRRFAVYGGEATKGCGLATTDSNTIYINPSHVKFFAKYVVGQDLWKTRAKSPELLNAGLCWAGGRYMYALRGGNTKGFFRFDTLNNTWCQRADAPGKVGVGGGTVYGGGSYLYALRGNGTRDFYRYHTVNNTWDTRAQVPGAVKDGGSLVWTGGDFIYALRGDDKRDFYRYQISTNQWVSKMSTPEDVDDGGALVYDANTGKLYAFRGNNTQGFYCYNVSTNAWSYRRATPRSISSGAALAYCDHSIFGCAAGSSSNNFWRYSPPVGGDDGGEEGAPTPTRGGLASLSPFGGRDEDLFAMDDGSLTDMKDPTYSPDGQWVIFVAYDSARDCMALYKVPAAAGLAAALTTDSVTYAKPVCSATGYRIAAAGDSGLYVVPLAGGMSQQLVPGVVDEPRFMPGDSWVMYEQWDDSLATHVIHKVRVNGTGDTCLAAGGDYTQPQPKSGGYVSAKQKGEVVQLCMAGVTGESWLTSDYCENACPALSPDGTSVAYQKLDESHFWQIYVMKLANRAQVRLTNGTCNCETPKFSPDGLYVTYTVWPEGMDGPDGCSKICYAPCDSGAEVDLNQPDAIREHPDWSPDCAYIVFESAEPDGGDKSGEARRTLARVKTGLVRRSALEVNGGGPTVFALHQNVPNPFSATTRISYAIPATTMVELEVFDVGGRLVRRLAGNRMQPGSHTAIWDGSSSNGDKVAAGTYFYVLKADGQIAQRRMLLVR